MKTKTEILSVSKRADIAKIVRGKWNAKQLQAIVRLADWRGGGLEVIAEEIGVHHKTITEWKKLPGFLEDVARVAVVCFIEADLMVDRATLRTALMDPVEHPEVARAIMQARELYYKRRGLLVERQEVTGAGGGPLVLMEVPPDGYKE